MKPHPRPRPREIITQSDNKMQIFLNSGDSNICAIQTSASETISELKHKISTITGIPSPYMRLVSQGKSLPDPATISSLKITKGAQLTLNFALKGGGNVCKIEIPEDNGCSKWKSK